MSIRLQWARVSEIGERDSNQDALGESVYGPITCLVLADGAGGHAGGEMAARLVVDAVLDQFAAQPVCNENLLLAFAGRASQAVATGRRSTPEFGDMSATLAAVLVDSNCGRAHWGHLGDSRVYLFRDARVHTVTRDHSVTQQFIDAGFARADQLRRHPQRNILYAAIGAEGDMTPSLSEPDILLQPGDALLICSDGLWEWVMDEEMASTLAACPNANVWLSAMCELAQARHAGSGKKRDNFSAFAVRVLAGQP